MEGETGEERRKEGGGREGRERERVGKGGTERRWGRSEENGDRELSGLQGQQKVVIAFHKPSCSFSGDALK